MKLKAILLATAALYSLIARTQDKCKELQIYHSYEHLYLSYTAPQSCCDVFLHGPITVKDSLIISKIIALLDSSTRDLSVLEPDVRFKVELLYFDKKETLCFDKEGAGMLYNNVLFRYNNELCSLIIDIIEQSGAEKPKRVSPPPPRLQCD